VYEYLRVGREEGELQRPAVLDAAGDHAGQEEPDDAYRRLPARIAALLLAGADDDAALQVHGGPLEALLVVAVLLAAVTTVHGYDCGGGFGGARSRNATKARGLAAGKIGGRERTIGTAGRSMK